MLAPEPKPVKTRGKENSAPTVPPNLAAQAYLLAQLPPASLERGVVWCLPSSREVDRANTLLRFFLGTTERNAEILKFPEDFFTWLNGTAMPHVLMVASEHLGLALPSAKAMEQNTLVLKTGELIKPFTVIRQLEAAGYEPGPLADTTGWFEKVGGTITIASGRSSWRCIWNADRLERLQALNLSTGTSSSDEQAITILPRRLPADPKSTIGNYLEERHTLMAVPAYLTSRASARYVLNPLVPSPLVGPVPLFGKQWEELSRYLNETKASGWQATLYTCEPRLIEHALEDAKCETKPKIVEVSEGTAAELEGFRDEAGRTVVLTDRELTGTRHRKQRAPLAAFERLDLDDYLVHIDHGIGRFRGLVTQAIDEVTRDYFMLEYAEEDKLYVPIEHTDRLSRYLGEPNPKLQRLHDASWFQTTQKVRAEAMVMARELLNVYAKRATSSNTPWQHSPQEEILASTFPYPLTPDQLKAWADISADLDRPQPMDRLVCGDVGFGKTELAVRAAFRGFTSGFQVAVLAPTTILAQQHFDTFTKRLKRFGVRAGLVSRAESAAEVRQVIRTIAEGELDIVIGTHRVLARDVHFKRLGLLIIDEEQRFGVKQKEELKALKPALHVLSLSATPIPRTLHLAVSSLRDLSIISTPPAGRQSVETEFCPPEEAIIKTAIERELARGGQVYYLVNHIADLPATESKLKRLLPTLTIGVVHGELNPKQLSNTMHRFDEGELKLLLATTIIENGLDLPNVNTLIVEGAEHLGLSDLYQLRGRVGRGQVQAYAFFLLGDKRTAAADKRMEALAQAQALGSGLTIALRDLELRGAGAILGREQHGRVSAVGLHLYGQLLAQAIDELQTGEPMPTIPEVLIRLPLEGRIHPSIVPDEKLRIHLYQRLASIREPGELLPLAEELLGRPLQDAAADRLFKNLLTLLELKLLAERARLREVTYRAEQAGDTFSIRFLETPQEPTIERLVDFDDRWHKVEGTWQAKHPLAAGAWISWLRESLTRLGK